MELIIQVKDSDAGRVQEFLTAANKKVRPHKGIPGVVVRVENGGNAPELFVPGINITTRGMPKPTFKVGDVVENTKSGNWGVVTSVTDKKVLINCSIKTRLESGRRTMQFSLDEAALMV